MSWISAHANSLLKLMLTMFKVGLVGFGGGSALIPVLHDEAVQRSGLVSEEEFNKDVLVATITPGALPVEIAAGIGRKIAGVPGMLLGSASIAFPGVLVVVLACSILSGLGDVLTRQINYLAIGVSGYIIAVLIGYVHSTMKIESERGTWKTGAAIILLVFALTCGKHLHKLLEIDPDIKPIFGIPTVDMVMVALFIIFWTQGKRNAKRVYPALGIALLYCLTLGGISSFMDIVSLRMALRAVMLVMAAYGIWKSVKDSRSTSPVSISPIAFEIIGALILVVVFAVPAILIGPDVALFLKQGCISSVLSFGGGDAYLSVASGVFVASGLVSYHTFYSILVPAANASPGSILCEIFAGCGFFVGSQVTGSVWGGFFVAACGFACSIAMSCLTFSVVNFLYERFEDLSILDSLKRLIRPIVSGLLLTVVLSLAYNCMFMGRSAGWPSFVGVVLCLAFACLNGSLVGGGKIKPLWLVFGSAAGSLVLCNALGLVF